MTNKNKYRNTKQEIRSDDLPRKNSSKRYISTEHVDEFYVQDKNGYGRDIRHFALENKPWEHPRGSIRTIDQEDPARYY